MAFIGNTPTTQAFTPAVDYFSGNGSTTAFTLSRPVASVAQVQVTIDNVAQNPSSAYTVSSNTITFTSAPLSGTNNIYVYYTSPITQVIAPGQGTAGTNALDVYGGAGTSAMNLPSGTTAQRPGTPVAGAIRYNSTTFGTEIYQNGSWQSIPFTYSIDYLVVAGGGGGGGWGGGGGGAGGYLSATGIYISTGTTYTVTVGAGGVGTAANASTSNQANGDNSLFGSLATAIGGGKGGDFTGSGVAGGNGGSGGGGSYNFSGGTGTSGQGYAGGNGLVGSPYPGGGGGGASAVGGNYSGSTGGVGGAGTAWLNGTTYAGGGGGGGGASTSIGGAGGAGGGGAGGNGSPTTAGTSGTSNTGGGGGGAGSASTAGVSHLASGSGGSGVVIVRYSGSQRATGGTVTSAGGYTYHTFTTSSTFTA